MDQHATIGVTIVTGIVALRGGMNGDRRTKEGRYLIALAHEGTMRRGSPPRIGSPWASADGFRRALMRLHSCFAAFCLRLGLKSACGWR